MEKRDKRIMVRLSETQYNNMVSACQVLGVNTSDFVRVAINSYISQSMIQKSCVDLARVISSINFDGLDNEKAEEISEMLRNIGGFYYGCTE